MGCLGESVLINPRPVEGLCSVSLLASVLKYSTNQEKEGEGLPPIPSQALTASPLDSAQPTNVPTWSHV